MTPQSFLWSVVVSFLLSLVAGLIAVLVRIDLKGTAAEVWVWGASTFATCMTLCVAVAVLYAMLQHTKK
ncbi:hypothetical protein [Streptomyces genisteinicus]|uniref:Uncharacterized protein n=1 Tax=Streptomyces genisteinicus TaxID=2768068 RepID=A0A7H0HNN7_9ACTN|nr:hypothetical protein [Streptomyces genisteinicus]QNP62153.1 hypothetical protein IAG43_03880 [Streptomyces genisteinicus]